jgi:ribosomal-protein-alanine N-acetyltransferase
VVLVAEAGEALIGFGVMGQTSGRGEIESLAVSLAWRQHGVGRRLCEELMAWARARGATEASLEVRLSNAAARALYRQLGFRECGMRRGYYRDPVEDALVMTKTL